MPTRVSGVDGMLPLLGESLADPFTPPFADQYFCIDDPASAFDNVELQPDGASDAGTAFTRYTAAPTTQATSRATSQRSSCAVFDCLLGGHSLTSFFYVDARHGPGDERALRRLRARRGASTRRRTCSTRSRRRSRSDCSSCRVRCWHSSPS